MKNLTKYTLLIMSFLFSSYTTFASIIYVDLNATGLDDGTSWANAYTDLQDALTNALSADEIWVAKGVYFPTTTTNQAISFDLPSDVSVYGGFNGTELSTYDLSLRDFDLNTTILSGDIDGDGTISGGNSFHVVSAVSKTGQLILDGFQIIMGNASSGSNQKGGGIYALDIIAPDHIQISNCEITECRALNIGGGASFSNVNGSFAKSFFLNCFAGAGGSGVSLESSIETVIENCQFIGNAEDFLTGGVAGCILAFNSIVMRNCLIENNETGLNLLYSNSDNSLIENTTFKNNYSGYAIKAVESDNSTIYNCNFIDNVNSAASIITNSGSTNLDLINCSFKGNGSSFANAAVLSFAQSTSISHLYNCIFWDNISASNIEIENNNNIFVENSIVEGGYAGVNQTNVINQDPLWIDSDLNLAFYSPAKDAGDNLLYTSTSTTDIDGDSRTFNSIIDIGAQELQTNVNLIYVNHQATGSDDGTSWTNAYVDLQDALTNAVSGDEIWVAKGTYYPTTPATPSSPTQAEQEISFDLPSDVGVYGGFDGTELSNYDLSLRDFDLNTTILSGDIDRDGIFNISNSFHVVSAINKTGQLVLDGFQIIRGYAGSQPGSNKKGGGIYALNIISPNSLQVSNCELNECRAKERGGGAYFNSVNGSFIKNTFSNCYARLGAGLYLQPSSTPTLIENCHFTGNTVNIYMAYGNCVFADNDIIMRNCLLENSYSGLYLHWKSDGSLIENTTFKDIDGDEAVFTHLADNCTFFNCNFIDNSSNKNSIIYNHTSANMDFVNCSFKGNSYTGGHTTRAAVISVYRQVSTSHLYNCIFWDNTSLSNVDIHNNNGITVEDCIVEGGYLGVNQTNVINQDPLWMDADLNLAFNSPAKDAGDNLLYTSSTTTDIDGDSRTFNFIIDIGAQELQTNASLIHVNHQATGSDDGTSWTNAFVDLQDALNSAVDGDEIWVAKGTYYPTTPATPSSPTQAEQEISFDLPSDVGVYGGFDGTELSNYDLSLRDFDLNTTILSGDIDRDGIFNISNSFHVVSAINKTGQLVLDGFQIIRGYAGSQPGSNKKGGGIYALNIISPNSLQVSNCELNECRAKERGGGAYFNSVNGSFIKNTFSNCYARLGAGLYLQPSSTPTLIENCHFTGNTVNIYMAYGNCVFADNDIIMRNCLLENSYSGLYLHWKSDGSLIENTTFKDIDGDEAVFTHLADNCTFFNCNFIDNSSNKNSIIYNHTSANMDFVNCSFKGNSYTGGHTTRAAVISVYRQVSTSHLYNCIFWDNTSLSNVDIHNNNGITVEDCIVEGGYLGVNQTNVINQDPLWVDAVLNLDAASPAIDVGDNTHYTSTITVDINGDDRFFNTDIDLGSQEYYTIFPSPRIKFTKQQDEKAIINDVVVYPNPSKEWIMLNGIESSTRIEIYGLNGQKLLVKQNNLYEKIDINHLPSGVYFINIIFEKSEPQVKRLIKQ